MPSSPAILIRSLSRLLGLTLLFGGVLGCEGESIRFVDQSTPLSGEYKLVLPDGSIYQGQFKDGVFSGRGSLTFNDGATYTGDFLNGRMHGQGEYLADGESSYIGTFANGDTVETGRIELPDGSEYTGEWQDWDMHGTGRFVEKEGAVYTGEFEYGSMIGTGSIDYGDGRTYKGEIDYFEPSGQGHLVISETEEYQGEFEWGRYNGEGKLTKDGRTYDGNFSYNKYDGQGTLTWLKDGVEHSLTGNWKRGYYVGPDSQDHVESGIAKPNIERLLAKQPTQLAQALADIPTHEEGQADVYLLTLAGYYQQDVFYKEAQVAADALGRRLPITSHLALVNNPRTYNTKPLATFMNLESALAGLAQKMNTQEDVLLLFITSHGSKTTGASITVPGLSATDVSPAALKQMLDSNGFRRRMVVVSACYSGAFVDALADSDTIVISASAADKTSFGCSDDAELTFFGKAFFADALAQPGTLTEAFANAKAAILKREKESGYEPSQPQYASSQPIQAVLDQLWQQQVRDIR